MTVPQSTCPLSRPQVLEQYYLEHRAKLIDIAAFLDRVDRAGPPPPVEDFRLAAFVAALGLLVDGGGARARRVLELFSDPSTALRDAATVKGACGAAPGARSSGP